MSVRACGIYIAYARMDIEINKWAGLTRRERERVSSKGEKVPSEEMRDDSFSLSGRTEFMGSERKNLD